MSKEKLFGTLLTLLICAPSYGGTALDGEINGAQEQDASDNGLTDEAISRELELFRGRGSITAPGAENRRRTPPRFEDRGHRF